MSINFTGIKNVGYLNIQNGFDNSENHVLSFQLTNDYNGEDFDKFKKVLNKMNTKENYINPINSGIVTVAACKICNENKSQKPEYKFFVNSKELAINDKSLPLFSYLANVAKTIEAKKDEDLIVNKDYLGSKDFYNGTGIGYAIEFMLKADRNHELNTDTILEHLHSQQVAKLGAKNVNNSIQEAMIDYIG